MFSKPKPVKPPQAPAPEAVPDTSQATGEEEAKRAMKRSGYQKTILTGSLTPNTGKRQTLG